MNEQANSTCTVCHSDKLRSTLSFGRQPPANRFLRPGGSLTDLEERHPLSLGVCQQCGTIQLVDRMPIDTIRPRYEWLVYNEPEGHLDDLVEKLAALPGVTKESRILGITYKDASTLDRMARRGFTHTKCVSVGDFEAPVKPFGLETIQAILSEKANVARLRRTYGEADVVLLRHVAEHAPDASRLIDALRGLLAPGGYIVLEVPDSERILSAGNHAFVWEEHFSYFIETSLGRLAQAVGAELAWFGRYVYPYEDSLIAVFRFDGADAKETGQATAVKEASESVANFAVELEQSRVHWRAELEGYRARGETVAMFGAGHLAVKFINFLNMGDLIDCVVDDHPQKAGLLMPGSHRPIVPSAELAARGVTVCISTLNPESEARVRQKLTSFFDGGGCFVPAFATG